MLYLGMGLFVVVGVYLGVGLGAGDTVVVVGAASVVVVGFFIVNP